MFKIDIDNEIHLELIHPSHAKKIFSLIDANRESLKKWLIWVDRVQSVEDEKEAIKGFLDRYAQNKSINCAVFYKDTLVGDVELVIQKGYGTKQGVLGYWLDSKFQGKGIMSRATAKMLEIAFDKYSVDKVILRCAVKNEKSCRIAQKLGMTHEGRLREDSKINGIFMDIDIYGLLKEERYAKEIYKRI